ncbi:zinc finger CCCH domain-containing protein 15-like [Acanthaster planci]|uniref:Zinc finger CCCH domain-containing protein 15 n=1 Tax=Acanthaster planci TaxID=133434 RepID=A0A8B8A2S6_ACAPL|nr:zinc finger CCCH domain-containing protein 15-like [Acanthaster planci]
MPPKKQQQPSKKTVEKKKDKIIEDKTFGLKNKKGAKTQNYIKTVTNQVKYGNQKAKAKEQQEQLDRKSKKKQEQEEINMLFKPVTAQQKVAKGVDPKSVVCAFFKQGTCTKGDKCKFSHDLAVERKSAKRNLYEDTREDDLANDTMDNWDEEKLKTVVDKKHQEENSKKPKTDKVCKYFLQAIEDCKYGWFWVCPNGGDKCMYRHALPPGFVLKSHKKKQDEEQPEQQITIEELIEEERSKLGAQQTKITLETFLEWKKKKIAEKKALLESQLNKKTNLIWGFQITGRELFAFNPDLVGDDDDEAADDTQYRRGSDDEGDAVVKDVRIENITATEVDGSGTVSMTHNREGETSTVVEASLPGTRIDEKEAEDEDSKLDQAAALPADETSDQEEPAAAAATVNGVPVDENLFVEDVEVDEDLFDQELDLEEDMDDLNLRD